MRQVGDRLVPIGVTSGRAQVLTPEEGALAIGANGETSGGRRSRRTRHQMQDLNNMLGSMGLGGADLEEVRSFFFWLSFLTDPRYDSS